MLPTYVRYGIAVVAGAIAAVILLYIMQAVISTDKNPLNEAPKIRILEFVRLMEDVPPEMMKPEFDEPPPPDEMPPDLPDIQFTSEGIGSNVIDISTNANIDVDLGGFNMDWDHDGEYLPLNKVLPDYPTRALQRGIEGYVIVKFTVTAEGTVENPVVVESKPPSIFDRSAIRAALKFKYKPKVVNGEPVPVDGVLNRIRFEIAEQGR